MDLGEMDRVSEGEMDELSELGVERINKWTDLEENEYWKLNWVKKYFCRLAL